MLSILIDMTIFFGSLFWVYSVISLIRPGKPFKNRGQAAVSVGLTLSAMIILVTIQDAIPSAAPIPSADNSRVQVEAELTEEAKLILKANADAKRELAEKEKSEAEQLKKDTVLATIRTAIQSGEFVQAKLLAFRNSELLASELGELEAIALDIVRPLPASDRKANMRGYELLAVLNPKEPKYSQKASQYEVKIKAEEERARVARLKRFKVKKDEFNGTTFYTHRNAPKYLNSRSTIYPYIGSSNGRYYLRVKITYAASNWLFVENVFVKLGGSSSSSLFVSGNFERDNNSSIWEWVDMTPTQSQVSLLHRMASSSSVKIRYEGSQYRKDVTMRASDITTIRETLALFDDLKAGKY